MHWINQRFLVIIDLSFLLIHLMQLVVFVDQRFVNQHFWLIQLERTLHFFVLEGMQLFHLVVLLHCLLVIVGLHCSILQLNFQVHVRFFLHLHFHQLHLPIVLLVVIFRWIVRLNLLIVEIFQKFVQLYLLIDRSFLPNHSIRLIIVMIFQVVGLFAQSFLSYFQFQLLIVKSHLLICQLHCPNQSHLWLVFRSLLLF